jgi:hypothetical protein
MNVIITCDLYQTPLVGDKWVFQRRFDNINAFEINFWLDHICCFELLQVTRQSDDQFIEVLNRFQTATQNPLDITFLNSICLCQPPNEPDFLYICIRYK